MQRLHSFRQAVVIEAAGIGSLGCVEAHIFHATAFRRFGYGGRIKLEGSCPQIHTET